MTEPSDHFNKAVEATAVVGMLTEKIENIDKRTQHIEADVRHIRHGMDRWGGAMVVVGALVSLATSIVAIVAGKFILTAMGVQGL